MTRTCPDCKRSVKAMIVGQTRDELLLQCPLCSYQWREALKP
jgi:uncharacterized C2H2 Zn-finger protein